jgi:hypothetical protein
MFKTLGIRTLMVCGLVTLTTLMTQQLLAQQATPTPSQDLLNITESTAVTEGDSGQVDFMLENISNQVLNLSFTPFTTSVVQGDSSDNLRITSNPPNGVSLKPGMTDVVSVLFDTPAHIGEVENRDFGNNLIQDIVTIFPGGTQAELAANVTVNDVSVVPEPSSLVLVGVCAFSMCGFGWLRRRRILSNA